MSDHITDDRLIDFLDGLAPDEESASISEHLEACPECRRVAEEIRSTDEFLKAELSPDPEQFETDVPDSYQEIMESVERSVLRTGTPGRQRTRVLYVVRKIAVSLAAGIILALTAYFFVKTPETEPFFVEIKKLPADAGTRGGTDEERIDVQHFYVELIPQFNGYLYLMDLYENKDGTGLEFDLICPIFNKKTRKYDVEATRFQRGDTILIPPKNPQGELQGFPVDQPGKAEYIFLIPSRIPIETAELEAAVDEIRKEILPGDSSMEQKRETILNRLLDRYPNTKVKSFCSK